MSADRDTSKTAVAGKQCSKSCFVDYHSYPCGRTAKVIEDGEAFCGVHDPERQRKRSAAIDARINAKRAVWAEQDRQRAEDARKIACHDQLVAALEPFARFLEAAEEKPLRGADPETIYAIHTGTEWEAELKWQHLRDASAALAAAKVPQ